LEDVGHVAVRQDVVASLDGGRVVLLEHVLVHKGVSFGVVALSHLTGLGVGLFLGFGLLFLVVIAGGCLTNEVVQNGALLFVECLENIRNRSLFGILRLLLFGLLLSRSLVGVDQLTAEDSSGVFELLLGASCVLQIHGIYPGILVASGQNQRSLTTDAVLSVAASPLKLVRVDGEGLNFPVRRRVL